jgi:hypothetical protein
MHEPFVEGASDRREAGGIAAGDDAVVHSTPLPSAVRDRLDLTSVRTSPRLEIEMHGDGSV